MILNKTEKELISKEIETLEKASSVELVAVITQRSGDYKLASPMYSIFLVFCASLYFSLFTDKSTFELVQIQLLIFIGFYLFFEYFKDFFFSILPKSYKYQIASTNANKQFYNLKLDQTKTKQAIMFFVSLDEKYVEIICDEKILKEIPDIHWRFILDEFINDVKLNQLSSGYIKAINACSMILIEKFPIEKNDENELPNEVIEIKSWKKSY